MPLTSNWIMQTYIGKHVWIYHKGMEVEAVVIDAREVWGRIDILVRPAAGRGEAWVSKDAVRMQ